MPSITIDPAAAADIEKFEVQLERYLAGDLEEDAFRVFRLNNGIYGQRQGGHNQMVRVKLPYGSVTPDQLDMLGHIAEEYSRGWGHITTRQNVQVHFVPLERIPDLMRDIASVGLTSREACGDTVRNVQGCHLAGACPYEILDISAWAEAAHQHFLRHPLGQRLPRKFKINFSGCATDCGQAMFNDVGVIAAARENEDGTDRGRLPGLRGRRPRRQPPPRPRPRGVHPPGRADGHHRGHPPGVRQPREPGQQAAGPAQVAGRHHGLGRAAGQDPQGAQAPGGLLHLARRRAPRGREAGRRARRHRRRRHPDRRSARARRSRIRQTDPYDRWEDANVVRGSAKGTVSAYAWARLGDITSAQFRALAAIQREFGADVRVTNRQNLVFRGLDEAQLPRLYERLAAIGMAEPGAELSRDVVACPGADTCNLAVTQSRGLADAIGARLEEEGLAEVGGVRTNISGCTNSCGQHHASDIGFFGAERRAHGKAAPGYQMLLGGYVGQETIEFGRKALRLPARNAPEAATRVVRRYADEREAGEAVPLAGSNGSAVRPRWPRASRTSTSSPPRTQGPEYYVDYDETGPYEAVIGDSECAT